MNTTSHYLKVLLYFYGLFTKGCVNTLKNLHVIKYLVVSKNKLIIKCNSPGLSNDKGKNRLLWQDTFPFI